MSTYLRKLFGSKIQDSNGLEFPDSGDGMTAIEHLEELRKRVIYAAIGLVLGIVVAMFFGKNIIYLVQEPFQVVMQENGIDAKPAAFTTADGFWVYMHVSLLGGLILSAPWVSYQIWKFVSMGLHRNEKRFVGLGALFSGSLFVCGAIFFLKVVAYPMFRFFLSFNIWLEIQPVIRIRELVSQMVNLMLVFGIAFQIPVVVVILGRTGLATTATLTKYRRHVIAGSLILAAIVTSPSPVDQVALAVPMWLLYELGIILVRFQIGRSKPSEQANSNDK